MIWVGLDLYPGWHTADPAGSNVRTLPAGAPQMNDVGADGSTDLNRLGSWFGAMSQANSDEAPDASSPASDLATGEHLGRRVAETATVFARGRTPTLVGGRS